MSKVKKISMAASNYVEFFLLCRSFADYKIDEDFEEMKHLAEALIDHPLDGAIKTRILKKNDLSIYDLEEAINFSPRAEKGEAELARCLQEASEILSYNQV